MQLRVMTEPQEGATYDGLLTVALESERLGFDAFFRSDHYQRIGSADDRDATAGLPGPSDAWAVLAGLARDTTRIRLGTMVSSATFRLPGPLAITVATVDRMSDGRVELGLGSGWYEAEHTSYGIPFASVAERFKGAHYTLRESPALPKPVQQPLPVIIGGTGPRRTPALAARFAAEYNVPFATPDRIETCFHRVRRACEDAGRDPASIVLSAAQTLAVGSTEAEVARRAAFLDSSPEEVRTGGLGGTVDEVVDKLGRLGDLGTTRVYLQLMDIQDLDQLRLVAAEVAPQVT